MHQDAVRSYLENGKKVRIMQHMKCPYCASHMRPSGSVSYSGAKGLRIADWVRCVRCGHATVANLRTVFHGPRAKARLELVS